MDLNKMCELLDFIKKLRRNKMGKKCSVNEFATMIALGSGDIKGEGKKKEMSIGQIKESLKVTNELLQAKVDKDKVIKMLEKRQVFRLYDVIKLIET